MSLRRAGARPASALLLALGLVAALLLGACATAPPAEPEAAATAGVLDIEAPPDLKALLDKHLDIAKVSRLAKSDSIDDFEWTRLIAAAPAQVRDLLQTEGHFEPKVDVQSHGSADERRVTLTVDPGARVKVGRVTLEVEGELFAAAEAGDEYAKTTLAELRRNWRLAAGKPFRNPDWSDAKAAALARLRAAGFAAASWAGTGAEVDADTHEARLFLVADSGPLFRYGRLEVEGLAAHDLVTVQNLAAVPVGAPVSESLLLDYQERLQKSGLFDSVTVTLDTEVEQAAAARIDVRLREAPLQVWTTGIGVSANTGPRASVEHTYRRVFGAPLTAHNKIVWGGLERSWTGEISTHPGENLYRNLLGGAVDRLESDSDVVLSQQLRLGRTQDTQRIERLYYVEGERSARTTLGDNPVQTTTVALSLNYHWVWRSLDSVVLPTEGSTWSLQAGVGRSHGTDAETGYFARGYGRATWYLPIGTSWYGQVRVELGQVFKKDTVAVPESQLFRAGGDDSVRGYSYRSLGPLVDGVVSGGTHLFTGSLEIARPFANMPSLWWATFVDAGNAANDWNGLDPALGAGIGLRWRSPVGPLRLDWAYGREVRRSRLHFSVGIAF
jgi:translocation and assembly module TamA